MMSKYNCSIPYRKLISVVMPVFNGEVYVSKAIESICCQTYSNLEYIIINDGSTDATSSLIHRYQKHDKRIRVITHKKNCGIVRSLNEGVLCSKGFYIARMDADDISLSHRLEKQLLFMENHDSYGVVSSSFYVLRKNKLMREISAFPNCDDLIKTYFLMTNPFPHGAVMMRRTSIEKYFPHLYFPQEEYFEDYALWSRLLVRTKFMILEEPLYIWRDNVDGISNRNKTTMINGIKQINDKIFPYIYNSYIHNMTPKKYFSYFLREKRNIFLSNENKDMVFMIPLLKMYQKLFFFIAMLFFKKKRLSDAILLLLMSTIMNIIYFIQKIYVIYNFQKIKKQTINNENYSCR